MTIFFWLLIAGISLLILAAIPYFIYLFGITFGKKISPVIENTDKNLPPISIVICAFREERNIGRKIQSIYDCSYPKDKIETIIVVDKSEDNTEGVAREILSQMPFPWKVYVNNERTGKNKSLNMGIEMAANNIIIDTDADVIWAPDTVELLVKRLISDDKIAAVSADLQPNTGKDAVTSMETTYRSFFGRMSEWESANDATYSFNGNLIALKKDVIGGITEVIGPDDANIAFVAIRKGYRTIYENQAKVFEDLPENMKKQYSQKARRAKGLIQATLANRDILKMKRPFAKIFYPLRIALYVITPTLFILGSLLLIIGLAVCFPILLGILLALILIISLIKRGNLITSFALNQFYLFMGLYSRRKDAVIWDSTSKKIGED
jgi:Glycosyltransferases, probably involved in cell wall biogenesis